MVNSPVSKLETFCYFGVVNKITSCHFEYSVKCLKKKNSMEKCLLDLGGEI